LQTLQIGFYPQLGYRYRFNHSDSVDGGGERRISSSGRRWLQPVKAAPDNLYLPSKMSGN
jgi:hypothetical protein